MGLLIGDTAIASYNGLYAAATPQIQLYGNPVVLDTLDWVKVGGIYTAHGGEQYITIGNFQDDKNTDTISIESTDDNGAGYGIDDVSVIPLDSMLLYADAGRDTTIYKGDSVFIGSRLCGLTNVVWYDSAGAVIDTGAPGFWVSPAASTYYIITQNVNGFYSADTVYITVINPLPVVLAWFKVTSPQPLSQGEGQGPLLSWETLTEVNVSHFNVQRSLDGKSFETIGTVASKGVGSYSFIDPAAFSPSGVGGGSGVRFYRLQIVDKDGSKSYSKVLSVSLTTNNSPLITVYPNPAKSSVTVKGSHIASIQVIDNIGRVVKVVSLKDATNPTLSVSGLPDGVYHLRVQTSDGGVSGVGFVKE